MLLEAHALLTDTLGRELEEAGAPPLTWYDVLVQLAMAPEDRLPMKRLAESVVLSKSGITRLVDRMVDAGYIERAACPTDRRIVYAQLTPSGRAELKKAMPVHFAGVERHLLSHLTDPEARALRNALGKVIDAARETGGADGRKAG
jgi:DNA-binding MarR family transcriptional regulator